MSDGTSITGFFTGKKTTSGNGTKVWTKGNKKYVYKGVITNGNIGSQGTFEFPDGRVYIGDCADGLMQGTGSYSWTDPHLGNVNYNGDFYANKFNVKKLLKIGERDNFLGEW